MKLLLDACVWPGAVSELARHGNDVVWVGDWPIEPGDDEILAFAVKENRVVVTLDKASASLLLYSVTSTPASSDRELPNFEACVSLS